MSELLNVIRKHQGTFYNYATNAPTRRWPSTFAKVATALLASIFCSSLSTSFLGSVLTVYAILIGFSFNVLVYLLSFAKERIDVPGGSIEADLRGARIHKLTEELFFNVSYFNLVSIGLVVITLICFLTYLPIPAIDTALSKVKLPDFIRTYEALGPWATALFRFVYLLLIVESLAALIRTIERISFFFSLKSKTPDQ